MAIDLNSISRPAYTRGAADAIVCIDLENDSCEITDMRRWRFDCHGHFLDIDNAAELLPAPPRSVAGGLAALACAPARNVFQSKELRLKEEFMRSRFYLSGFLLKAAMSCGDSSGKMMAESSRLIGMEELEAFQQTHIDRAKKWMIEGERTFDQGLTLDGAATTCAYASTVRAKAKSTIHN